MSRLGRDRDRDRDRKVTRDDLERLHVRVDDSINQIHTVGRLSLQTAHKVGSDSARRSLVFFAKGEVKQVLSKAYTSWQATSKLPPGECPTTKPVPFKLQVVNAILAYIQDKLKDALEFQDDLELLKSLPGCTEAVTQNNPPEGQEAWPLVLVLRNCNKSASLRECLLQEKWRTYQGRDHNLGWRAARHQPTAPARAVLAALGLDTKGKGKGVRRSPKREAADRADASTASRRRRT